MEIVYTDVIKALYPNARAPHEDWANFEVARSLDENGQPYSHFFYWAVPGVEPPTFAELDTYANSPEYRLAHLAKSKSEAVNTLNAWRSARRRALGLSMADFQELVYSGKMMQAQRWLDDPTQRFYFTQEAAARGISHFEMAQIILGQGEAWLLASDVIEAGYINIKALIEASQDEEQIAGILEGLTWP